MTTRPDPALLVEETITLAVEYGYFVVADEQLDDPAAEQKALHAALDSPLRATTTRNVLVVLSPAADTYETPVAVEVWSDRPAETGQWHHEVELDLLMPSGRLGIGTATQAPDLVEGMPIGSYRLLVSAWFDDEPTMPDSQQHYRLRLWPRTTPTPPRLVRAWAGW
jgi:hypothetical protein